MRGEGGYDDGSEEAPRLTVLDLQVEREEGGERGGEGELSGFVWVRDRRRTGYQIFSFLPSFPSSF